MQAMVHKTTSSDTLIGARATLHAGLDRIYAGIPKGRGWATYPFNTLTLGSHFQPIFSVSEQRCVAYEGLLSASNLAGQAMKPETVFAISASHHEELFLDWLCRGLHLRNFANLSSDQNMVFLNAYPEAAIEDPHHPQVFAQMIEFYGIRPRNVVVEILETGVSDEAQLIDAVKLYRKLGCKIAIDDFGIGFSNFDRLWRLKPDFVKIDRSVTASAVRDTHARLVLANMVKLIHECGSEVVIEGIETRDEALIALDVGADYLQGYYFARPGMVAVPQGLADRMFASLADERRATVAISPVAGGNENLEVYAHALNLAILDLQRGDSFARATESFRRLHNVHRVYLVAGGKRGDDENVDATPANSQLILDMIENPSLPTSGVLDSAMGQLDSVLQHALAAPHRVHVVSASDLPRQAKGFITLSCAFEHQQGMVVLCGDLSDRRLNTLLDFKSDNARTPEGNVIHMHL